MTSKFTVSLLTVMMLVCSLIQVSAQCVPVSCGGRTQTQGGWGSNPQGNNPGVILQHSFAGAFPSGLTVGCDYTLTLTSAQAVRDFLPFGSTASALPGNLVDPGGSYNNVFAGQVVALTISLRFDEYIAGFNTSGTPLKDQIIASGTFAGWTVQQVYDEAVKKLGGCYSPYSFSQLNNAISSINENYVDGTTNNGFLLCAPKVCCVSTNATCYGSATGSVTTTAYGAAPISYLWSNGATTANISNVSAGVYSVTITDGVGLTASTSCEVNQDPALVGTAYSSDVSCYQACDGTISLNVSGGVSPYVIVWSPAVANPNQVCAGTYHFTVTDAHGCTIGGSVSVNQPSLLSVDATAISPLCYGGFGSASAGANGGTAPYTYAWSTGAAGSSISNLGTGSYSVTVTDANGCTASDSDNVTVPSLVTATASSTNVSCKNACDGTASVVANGGTGSLSIVWSNGATAASLSNLCAGTYGVTVTDANGCSASDEVVISQPALLTVNVTAVSPLCYGGVSSASAVANGGTTPYAYLWNTGATSSSISGLGTGTYSVTVTDHNNCTATDSDVVNVPTLVTAVASSTHVTCYDVCNGTASVTANGGTGALSILWSNGATTASLSNLCAGEYGVTVTDANGCSASDIVNVNEPTQLVIDNVDVVDVTCANDESGSITVSVSGGTAPYSIVWDNGATDFNLTGLVAGTYCFTVTDANDCTVSGCEEISEPEALLAYSECPTGILCPGDCTGSIDVTVIGGTTPYTFAWSNGATTEDIDGLCAGAYHVTITDANGCVFELYHAPFEAPEVIDVTFVAVDPTVCMNACNGSISINVSGGTAPYTFVWADGETTQNRNGLCAGTYSVTVYDANGCSATHNPALIILLCPCPIIEADYNSTNDSNCDDNICDGSVSIIATGGYQPYTFYWNDGETSSSASRTGLCAGSYSVTIVDAYGCSTSLSVDVDCETDCPPLRTQTQGGWGTNPNGNNPGVYNHANFAAAFPEGLTIGCTNTLTLTSAQAVTDFLPSGSTASALPAGSLVNPGGSYNNVLAGQLVALTLSVTYDYYDPNFGAGSDNLGDRIVVSGLFAGKTVNEVLAIANDVIGGCSNAYTFSQVNQVLSSINENYVDGTTDNGFLTCQVCNLQASVQSTNVSCFEACDGSATVSVTTSAASYEVVWNDGATGASRVNLCPGSYSYTVTDAAGCEATGSVVITEPELLYALNDQADVTCHEACDGAAMLGIYGGTAPFSVIWSNGALGCEVMNLCKGTYTYTITDANNCVFEGEVTIGGPDALALNVVSVVDQTICGSVCDGSIELTVTGGTEPFTILWSDGSNGLFNDALCAGVYNATVTDANGCTAEISTGFVTVNCTEVCDTLRTQTQGGWGSTPNGNNPGVYLHANFAAAFPEGLTIGCDNTLTLTSAQAVTDFLPSGSTASALPAGSLVNPGDSYNNVLAAQLVAATISVTFDAYDPDFGGGSQSLGDMYIASGTFAGWTVNQVLAEANAKIGGCPSAYSFSQLNEVLSSINENYVDGTEDNGFLTCSPVSAAVRFEANASYAGNANIAAYPNPFYGNSTIAFSVEADDVVTLDVYNVTGQKVADLFRGNVKAGNVYHASFNGTDIPAGMYIYRLVTSNGTFTGNMVRVK